MHHELCHALCNTLAPFATRLRKQLADAFFGGFLAGAAVMLLIICLMG